MSWVLVAGLVNVVVSVGVVWRVHARLGGAHAVTPIGPGLAVLYLFLPLTNLLWLVVWPARASRQLGLGTGRGVACSGALVGGLTLEMLGAHGAVAVAKKPPKQLARATRTAAPPPPAGTDRTCSFSSRRTSAAKAPAGRPPGTRLAGGRRRPGRPPSSTE